MSTTAITTHTLRPAPDDVTRRALGFAPRGLLIGGAFVPASGQGTLTVEDPATGSALARVADATESDCRAALAAASAAGPAWAATAPRDRARLLRRVADRLRGAVDTMAEIVTREMGKPLRESRAEVEFAADYLEWYAEEAVRIAGSMTISPDGMTRQMVARAPVGPCLIVTPWNFPLAVPARGVGAALAAGCTVVLRPSSMTPLSSLTLGRIMVEEGAPAGVLNIVVSATDGATDPLLGDPRLRKLTFTGSQTVGSMLVARSADQMLRVSAELGGCAPFLVFDDADIDAAVEGALAAKMRNGGAACTAANRYFVQRAIAPEFTRRLAALVAGIRMGNGMRPRSELGPMIAARHVARLAALVADAVDRGATVEVRGGAVPGEGHFFAPVVLSEVPRDARVMREEIFGPIVAIAVFDDAAEAVALANACDSGLAAYIYTRDLARAMAVAGAIEAGMVAVNRGRVSCVSAPFGGVKQSGFGITGGADGLNDYLTTTCISMPLAGLEPAAEPPGLREPTDATMRFAQQIALRETSPR